MEIISTKEAANYLNITTFTVLRLIKRKSIKAERFGNYWAIDRKSVEEYKKRNTDKGRFDPTRE